MTYLFSKRERERERKMKEDLKTLSSTPIHARTSLSDHELALDPAPILSFYSFLIGLNIYRAQSAQKTKAEGTRKL